MNKLKNINNILFPLIICILVFLKCHSDKKNEETINTFYRMGVNSGEKNIINVFKSKFPQNIIHSRDEVPKNFSLAIQTNNFEIYKGKINDVETFYIYEIPLKINKAN